VSLGKAKKSVLERVFKRSIRWRLNEFLGPDYPLPLDWSDCPPPSPDPRTSPTTTGGARRIAVNYAMVGNPSHLNRERAHRFTPWFFEKYDLVLSPDPELVIYSVFTPGNGVPLLGGHFSRAMPVLPKGRYVRVFMTGENVEPVMEDCDFAVTFSRLIDHPNHLRRPLWVGALSSAGSSPQALVKDPSTDWEKVARAKTRFCNYVYSKDVDFRVGILRELERYKSVDAVGLSQNNQGGRLVPPGQEAKVDFLRSYKFTLALENTIWPGYTTEKLVEPMVAASIPIYVGDPQVHLEFNPESYIDFSRFASLKEMLEFVREVDNNDRLYIDMLSRPFYRDNAIPKCARRETYLCYFDRIYAEVLRRRGSEPPK
jgi:hypothetical protein